MLKLAACLLFVSLILPVMAQPPDFYQLNVQSNNVKFACVLNGFPVYHAEDSLDGAVSLPVQLYLVGKNNKLQIEGEAIDKSKSGTIHAQIVPYHQGDMLNSREVKNGVPTLTFEVKEKDRKELTFDNERFDFSATLLNTNPVSEAEARAYGKKLYGYLMQGDASGFVSEMTPKINDYSAAAPYSAEEMRLGLTQQYERTFFSKKAPAIPDNQITAIALNGNKIWEIRIGGKDFLRMVEDGGSMQMSVFVAMVNGQMSIVR